MRKMTWLTGAFLALLVLAGCSRDDDYASKPEPAQGLKAGSAWQALPLGTAADFRGIWFADATNGWIVGGRHNIPGGLLGRTRDGGKSWKFTSGHFSPRTGGWTIAGQAVHFFDTQRGLMAGNDGIILKTEDGGENWVQVPSGSGREVLALAFIDDRNGWAVGTNSMQRTRDGGAQWEGLNGGSGRPRIDAWAATFHDEDRGWLVYKSATLMWTEDGGATWSAIALPLAESERPDFHDIFFVDERDGWVVGDEGIILHTGDGGDTWSRQETGIPDARSAARPERIQHGSKVILVDTGDRSPGLTLTAVRFVDKRRGWAAGYYAGIARSLILRTEDGGANWTVDADLIGDELRALFIVDPDHVWAIGAHVRDGPQSIYRRGSTPGK
jgi:photosystem II stability/assembly factor-like uncharacterized protein